MTNATNTNTSQKRESAQHTPGNWQADFLTIYTKLPNEINEPAICEVYQENFISMDEAIANANLISAAPEMLEALEMAYAWFEKFFEGKENSQQYLNADQIAQAIAKAKGGRHE